MADAYTTSSLFTPKSDTPATPTAKTVADTSGFAERSRLGQLNAADDQDRINGRLGGTKDPVELNDKLREASGGHDNIWPLTNPEPPAVASEAVLHPGVDPSLVLPRDLARMEAAHEAAKAV